MIWQNEGHRVRACEVGSVGVGVLAGGRWTFQIFCQWIQRYLHRWGKNFQCGNSPVFIFFFFFLMKNRGSFYLPERKGQSLLPSLTNKHKICPLYPCAYKHNLHSCCFCLEMDSSSQVQIRVSSSYSFSSTHFCFPMQLESPLVYVTSELWGALIAAAGPATSASEPFFPILPAS